MKNTKVYRGVYIFAQGLPVTKWQRWVSTSCLSPELPCQLLHHASQSITSTQMVFSRCVFTWEAGGPGDIEVEVFGGIDEHVQIPVLLMRGAYN